MDLNRLILFASKYYDMMQFDTVLLTDPRFDNPVNPDQFSQNILTEDGLVQQSLEKLGVKCYRTSWDNPDFDWSTTKSVLFRTTWDYMDRYEEFSKWFEKINEQTVMFNPYSTIKWNLDKHYLQDLENSGIRIPETFFIEPGEKSSLGELMTSSGWNEAILKPAVSAGARHTYRLNDQNVSAHEEIFAELIKNESFLLQKFQHNIITKGEISMMMVNGKFTHAILKKAKPGDFRVQDDFGGSVQDYEASTAEIEFAQQVVSACDDLPSYARVDILRNDQDEPCVGELELIEPEMWFRHCPQSAELLARHLKAAIEKI